MMVRKRNTMTTACIFAVIGGSASAQAGLGVNVLVNSDAEAGTLVSQSGGFSQYSLPGWTVAAGSPVAQVYSEGGASNINTTSPGPVDRGNLYFAGGNDVLDQIQQTIDVSNLSSTIDHGGVSYSLSGWLGGFSNQRDDAILTAVFEGSSNNILLSSTIGPVTVQDRNSLSEMQFRSTDGLVPAGTRTVDVLLSLQRYDGLFNNGAADNLNLTFSTPEPSGLACFACLLPGALLALRRRKRH